MKIDKIVLRQMKMNLKSPFTTSFATQTFKDFTVVEIHSGNVIGYGDCSALTIPFYNEETNISAYHIMKDFLIPMLKQTGNINYPTEIRDIFSPIKRNKCAKAAIEGAVWDAFTKQKNIPLWKELGGVKDKVEAGVSIGIQPTPEALIKIVSDSLETGYRRIKIKIKPGRDIQYVHALRREFGDIMLMVDANSAYSLNDIELFKKLDSYNLLMIEQPLAHDDIVDHRKLQQAIETPICLDESIHTVDDARKAIELGSGKIINIKVARVGGITETKLIHDLCADAGIPVWCGGMLDTAIGKAHNLAVSTLSNFTLPNDIPPSSRYWEHDFMTPEVTMDQDSMVAVPNRPGIGFNIDKNLYQEYIYHTEEFDF